MVVVASGQKDRLPRLAAAAPPRRVLPVHCHGPGHPPQDGRPLAGRERRKKGVGAEGGVEGAAWGDSSSRRGGYYGFEGGESGGVHSCHGRR